MSSGSVTEVASAAEMLSAIVQVARGCNRMTATTKYGLCLLAGNGCVQFQVCEEDLEEAPHPAARFRHAGLSLALIISCSPSQQGIDIGLR